MCHRKLRVEKVIGLRFGDEENALLLLVFAFGNGTGYEQ
jgi:hypothetical protein